MSYALGRMLATPQLVNGAVSAIYASIPDRDAVTTAVAAGAGAPVEARVGAKVDSGPAPPATLAGRVRCVRLDDPVGGDIVVITMGRLDVVVTSRRKPYHCISDFTDLGLDPRKTDVVVIKIGYLEPQLYDAAADWRLALTPGGVDQDLIRLAYHNLDRPVFPLDQDGPEPDLTPQLV